MAYGRVRFHYDGAWQEPQLHGSTTPRGVRWICRLLSRLSEAQWRDAFCAGGFEEGESQRYIRRLQQKIRQGLRLPGE